MIVDITALQERVDKKLLNMRKHPTADLYLWDYTPTCQYDKEWDEYTLMCRGLITDDTGEVIARPFPKFFNLAEHESRSMTLLSRFFSSDEWVPPKINWNQSFIATEKMDGSLGILYTTGQEGESRYQFSTRGSFTSEQALKAKEMFYAKGYNKYDYDLENLTYLFEIIYPQNRIVVDYKGMEDLVLLEVIETNTGQPAPYTILQKIAGDIGCPVVKKLEIETKKGVEFFRDLNNLNEEGCVIRFDDGMRIKIKFDEYVRLHKLLTQTSARSIWESLMRNQSLEELLANVPDEFFDWCKKTIDDITTKHQTIERTAREAAEEIMKTANTMTDDKAKNRYIYEELKKRSFDEITGKVAYNMCKGKYDTPYAKEWLWRKIRPEASTPFKDDEA